MADITFTKKSTKRQIRKKVEADEEPEPAPVIIQRSKPKTNKAKKATPVLSFNDDEEAEESFNLKKSAASIELKKSKERKFKLREDVLRDTPEPVLEERVNYSKDHLEALKKESFNQQRIYDKFDRPEGIPDEHMVLLAKKKREELRSGRVSGDFIPLDDGADTHGDSRLVREEDEVGEGDEEFESAMGDKLVLGKNAAKRAQSRHRHDLEEMIEEAELDENDEELRRWEALQIRKVAGAKFSEPSTARPRKETKIPNATPIPTIGDVQKMFENSLSMLQETQETHSKELAQIDHDLQQSQTRLLEIDENTAKIQERLEHYRALGTNGTSENTPNITPSPTPSITTAPSTPMES
ncbi:hypothetical protein K493DRAFT_78056 [Basidiobolus meristosporus CBS 931.73]|uniref:Uncharacterized protein n=1 Tax=Basidiobolus meristosporus CBS 931.73 TaxID=1314790 RepID=A0A1Y1XRV7_9FUNG|nr:hypothetical protein K493DRAFT_78056 [Basidiobolus meristosporus CBS 931.73]|eukprot:ORX88463.1 hypothetical protein K493DRAFT_78056 [Basidiobolus meristosporus CBS 931.73]